MKNSKTLFDRIDSVKKRESESDNSLNVQKTEVKRKKQIQLFIRKA